MTPPARIAVARTFGPPSVITLEQQPRPELARDQVLVAVRAAGVNPVDARRRAGTFGGRPPLVFGTEFAGTVIESTDPAWRVGDDVVGWGVAGGNADLVLTDGARLVRKPAGLGWNLAGGFGGVTRTAVTALDALRLAPGDTMVVHGASGGVGTVLTQLALRRGLRVVGTASPANHDHLAALGAVPVAYGPGAPDRIGAAADGPIAASVDLAGTQDAGDVGAAVRDAGGQAITLVPETVASHGIPLVQARGSQEQMLELVAMVADERLTLPVDSVPFADIATAHERLDAKHARGKTVLDLSDNAFLPAAGGR